MPQTAMIEINTKAGNEKLTDKAEFAIGGYVAILEEVICANDEGVLNLYGGPANHIDQVIVKSDLYEHPKCSEKYSEKQYCPVKIEFANGNGQPIENFDFSLRRALFLSGECIRKLGSPDFVKMKVTNDMPRDIKISVMIIRSQLPVCSEGGCAPKPNSKDESSAKKPPEVPSVPVEAAK
ncbi:MAG: hypothetical protein R3C49_07285 [Planctomycetaceae bacterium]